MGKNYAVKLLLLSLLLIVSLALTGCMNELKTALDEGDTKKIVEIYKQADTAEKRKEVCQEINAYSFDWLEELVEYYGEQNIENTKIYKKSYEELEEYSKKLKFLDYINDKSLGNLVFVKENLDDYIKNEKDLVKEFPEAKDLTAYDLSEIETLDVYVVNRVSGNRYAVSSYEYNEYYDDAIPDMSWQAVVDFSEFSDVTEGITGFEAVQLGEERFETEAGFRKTLPVYKALSDRELFYVRFMNGYKLEKTTSLKNMQDAVKIYKKTSKENGK